MAKKILKWTAILLVAALVLIQFIRPEKNMATEQNPNDIVAFYNTPAEVANILHKACYDCHSNNTNYPWYNNIQPVASWLADHIDEGKDELNFSKFGAFKTRRKLKKLKEIVEEVEESEMPLDSYTWMHSEAKLTEAERKTLIEWAKGLSMKITLEEGSGS